MIGFFRDQMDYVLFLNGLAFVILASVCFILRKDEKQRLPWIWLGLFGVTRGALRFFQLIAESFGHDQSFGSIRILLTIASFIFLTEFGRAGIISLRGKGVGTWVHVFLAALTVIGVSAGFIGIDIASRYSFGLVGGLLASRAMLIASKEYESSAARWLKAAGISMGFYAAFAGVVVPPATFFPASLLNNDIFFRLVGLPVQLVRGFFAVLAAISIWVYSQSMRTDESIVDRRARYIFLPITVLLVIIALGWMLTWFAGSQAKKDLMRQGDIYADILSENILHIAEDAENAAKRRAVSPVILRALLKRSPRNLELAETVLNDCKYNVNLLGSQSCYLLDINGRAIASCSHVGTTGPNVSVYDAGTFRKGPGSIGKGYYAFNERKKDWDYYTKAAVKDKKGRVVGFALVMENLDAAEKIMREYPYSFLVSPQGIVFLSSNENFCLKSLWPLKNDVLRTISASGQFGSGPFTPILSEEAINWKYTAINGQRVLATRKIINPEGWSLVFLHDISNVKAYQMFSIFTTFVLCILTVLFFASLYFTKRSASRIALSEKALQRANVELELRVEERTAELANANDALLAGMAEQKKAEDALRNMNARLHALIQAIPDVVFFKDINGKHMVVNKAYEKFAGVTQENILGKTDAEILPPDLAENCRKSDSGVIETQKASHFEEQTDGRDGKKRFFDVVKAPIHDINHDLIGIVGVSREITERKFSEKALRDSEERFRSLFNLATDGIFLLDPTGGVPVIVDANPAACSMNGYSREELIGKPISFLNSGETAAEIPGIVAELMKGRPLTFEVSHLHKDGFVFPIEVSAQLIHIGERPYILAIDRNITERKKAEENLRLFSQVIEEAIDGVQITDLSGYMVYCNSAVEKIYGFSEEELLGGHVSELTADKELAGKVIIPSIKEAGRWSGELMVVHKDGHEFPIWLSASLVKNDRGEPFAMVGIIRDITYRKQIEHELEFRNVILTTQQEASIDGIIVVDESGKILSHNQRFVEMWGIPTDVIESKSDERALMSVLDKLANPNQFLKKVQYLYECREETSRDEIVLTDGRTFDRYSSPMFGHEGKYYGRVWYFRDITERKRIEEELARHSKHLEKLVEERTSEIRKMNIELEKEIIERREAESAALRSEANFRDLSQQFHTLLEAIPDTLVLLSTDLKVLWANKAATSDFGLEIPEIAGRRCYELWHHYSAPCDDCHALRCFRTGKEEDSYVKTPEGKLLDSRAFPIKDENGNVNSVILVVNDITEKMHMQAEAIRASHLASLGELAAGVAHEINNPINGIINYAQLLSNKINKESRENEIACRIIKEGDRIANIVKNLLSFARERKEEAVPVNIVTIIRDTITLTGTQMRKDGINLKINAFQDIPEIVANPQQIEQVFLNLISNARYALNQKYSGAHENKSLEISAEKVIIDDIPYVRITFCDHGIGIPEDMLDKVMNPFFTTKPSGYGTGLGLSISHGIIGDHKGNIVINSKEGEMTEVVIELPAGGNNGG